MRSGPDTPGAGTTSPIGTHGHDLARAPGLTKSRLLAYLQCPKRLWLQTYGPPPGAPDGALRNVFAQGRMVGAAARALYPSGILIEPEAALAATLARTRSHIDASRAAPLFEASFEHANVLTRADLLLPKGSGWIMAEVKSATGIRAHYLDDIAIQRWVAVGAGLALAGTELWHPDRGWTYAGDGDYQGLFSRVPVDAQAIAREPRVRDAVEGARRTLAHAEPELPMGPHCNEPFACPYRDYCASGLDASSEYPVTLLPNNKGKRLAASLLEDGYTDLREVPAARITDPELAMIHAATRTGRPHFDAAARTAIEALGYPRAHLDFETIGLAVPRWGGTRPYEPVPFQWSCHVESADGGLHHLEFLDASGGDPRRACALALTDALPRHGPILVYNAGFEAGVLRRLAARFDDLAEALESAARRLFDLLPLVRAHYYHRDMRGSRSIKNVLPTIGAGLDHDSLDEVREGMGVQLAYLEAIAADTGIERRTALEAELRRYCALDTLGLVELARFLAARPRVSRGAAPLSAP